MATDSSVAEESRDSVCLLVELSIRETRAAIGNCDPVWRPPRLLLERVMKRFEGKVGSCPVQTVHDSLTLVVGKELERVGP